MTAKPSVKCTSLNNKYVDLCSKFAVEKHSLERRPGLFTTTMKKLLCAKMANRGQMFLSDEDVGRVKEFTRTIYWEYWGASPITGRTSRIYGPEKAGMG